MLIPASAAAKASFPLGSRVKLGDVSSRDLTESAHLSSSSSFTPTTTCNVCSTRLMIRSSVPHVAKLLVELYGALDSACGEGGAPSDASSIFGGGGEGPGEPARASAPQAAQHVRLRRLARRRFIRRLPLCRMPPSHNQGDLLEPRDAFIREQCSNLFERKITLPIDAQNNVIRLQTRRRGRPTLCASLETIGRHVARVGLATPSHPLVGARPPRCPIPSDRRIPPSHHRSVNQKTLSHA